MNIDPNINIVVPTYCRPSTLMLLMQDLSRQTVFPATVYVVDGAPGIGDVKTLLKSCDFPWQTIYIPSNHANAPYQRYLGFRAVSQGSLLIYIDDDIRIYQANLLEKLIEPFQWNGINIAGISPQIFFPNREAKTKKAPATFTQIFNLGIHTQPGDITPVGDRIYPEVLDESYTDVKWLHGGVMAYKLDVLSKIENLCDAFAMSYIGCGLGVDDTYLSRCAMAHGKLLLALCATAEHPNIEKSRVTSENGFKKGFAYSYSRRFINDHYLPGNPPTFTRRLYLIKSYFGNIFLDSLNFLLRPSKYRLQFLQGYTVGAVKGIFVKPTAKNLTPQIDWLHEAEEALVGKMVIE